MLKKKFPSIRARDFHIFDRDLQFRNSLIVAKEKIILIKLHFIRCIITSHVIMISTRIENNIPSVYLRELENNIMASLNAESNLPFELRVMEPAFITIKEYYDSIITEKLTPKISVYYGAFSTGNLTNLVRKRDFSELYKLIITTGSKVDDICSRFTAVCDYDNDRLDDFYLTREHDKNDEERNDVLLDILETYKAHFEENVDDIDVMTKLMDGILKITSIEVGMSRNTIAKFDINVNIMMLAFAIVSVVTSVLGMNVKNHIEDIDYAIWIIISSMVLLVISVFLVFSRMFKNVVIG
jgi:hypothetical protein